MSNWESDFRHRIDMFEAGSLSKDKGITVSIKIRVTSGCFHREHSPNAYRIIDDYLHSYLAHDEQISFVEHESGPELLVYLALGTAGITLAKSVIDLITAIIKARSEGIKHGDHPSDPIELIVRSFDENEKIKEEKILRVDSRDIISKELIEKTLQSSVNKMIPKNIKKKRHHNPVFKYGKYQYTASLLNISVFEIIPVSSPSTRTMSLPTFSLLKTFTTS